MNNILYVVYITDGEQSNACGYFDTAEKAEKARKILEDFCDFEEFEIEFGCDVYVCQVNVNKLEASWFGRGEINEIIQ